MGSSSRRKGASGEREACVALTALTGAEWKRSLVQTRLGGCEAPDVVCAQCPGLQTEVKRGKRNLNLWGALKQATEDAGEDRLPWVVARRDREEWVALVRLEDLPELCRRLGLGGE